MSLNCSGLTALLTATSMTICVSEQHRLIKLANTLPWAELAELVVPDLKASTPKLAWWLGRPLQIRTHLGVYLLQQMLNATDRGVEQAIQDNAVYQMFCGRTVVKNWRCPDYTKIEEFRSRLSPNVQCQLANYITALAAKQRFANPAHVDIDATIQEANCQHPAVVNLMIKTAVYACRLRDVLMTNYKDLDVVNQLPYVNLKAVKGKAKAYFFASRKNIKDRITKQIQALKVLWQTVAESTLPVLQHLHYLQVPNVLTQLPNHLQRSITNFSQKAPVLLDHWFMELFEGTKQKGNIYAYHLNEVSCFNKNKMNKKVEIGRNIQLMRLEGNFAVVLPCTSVRMPDAASIPVYLALHQDLFGQGSLASLAADKGYYAKNNEALLLSHPVEQVGLQRPNRKLYKPPDNPISPERQEQLINRRSGIEAMISHIKHGGQLGRSRMKSDSSTEAEGYCAVLGFNLRQMMRYLIGDALIKAA